MKHSLGIQVAWFLVMTATAVPCEATEPSPAQNNSPAEPESWVKHSSKDGGFEVLFPGAVEVKTQKLATGQPLIVASAKSSDGQTHFSASFDNYTTNSTERYFEGVRRGMVARGQLDKMDLLKVAGKPAASYAFHQNNGETVDHFHKLIVIETNRVYQLVVGSRQQKPSETEIKKFYESFRLTK